MTKRIDFSADANYNRSRLRATAAIRPMAFTYQGQRFEISEIMDRWYEGGFKPCVAFFQYCANEFKANLNSDCYLLHLPTKRKSININSLITVRKVV
jgi:hypothetical protein